MNRSIIIVATVILASIIGFFFINQQTNKNTPQESISRQTLETTPQSQMIDKQASFAIFTNGTFRVFTASMYHNLSEYVFIQADNPNIVHVKKAGVTWNDFFKTLPFKLTSECLTTGTKETFCTGTNGSLRFYLNGNQKQNVLEEEIKAGDQLVVTFGRENAQQIQEQIQKLHDMIN